jgi:hypothetical protein
MTYLEAINSVLRRLREDEVSASSSTAYGKLIAELVNDAIHECEHAYDWHVLKDTITITTAASTATYNFWTEDTKVIKAVNQDKSWYMRLITDDFQVANDYVVNLADGSPYFYNFQGKSGDYNQIKLTPTPTGVESIQFFVVKYSAPYELDGSDDSSVIQIPSLPVVLTAYAKAVLERGEDGGIGFNDAIGHAHTALADAISLDMSKNHISELAWHPV